MMDNPVILLGCATIGNVAFGAVCGGSALLGLGLALHSVSLIAGGVALASAIPAVSLLIGGALAVKHLWSRYSDWRETLRALPADTSTKKAHEFGWTPAPAIDRERIEKITNASDLHESNHHGDYFNMVRSARSTLDDNNSFTRSIGRGDDNTL